MEDMHENVRKEEEDKKKTKRRRDEGKKEKKEREREIKPKQKEDDEKEEKEKEENKPNKQKKKKKSEVRSSDHVEPVRDDGNHEYDDVDRLISRVVERGGNWKLESSKGSAKFSWSDGRHRKYKSRACKTLHPALRKKILTVFQQDPSSPSPPPPPPRYPPPPQNPALTIPVLMYNLKSDAGLPLRIAIMIDAIKAIAYLDTGAGVVVLGGGWLAKREKAGLPPPTLTPSSLELKGVNRDALAKTTGVTKVNLKIFNGKISKQVGVQGVVCPQWEGDIVLSIGCLKQLGFSVALNSANAKDTVFFNTLKMSVQVLLTLPHFPYSVGRKTSEEVAKILNFWKQGEGGTERGS